MVATAFGDGLVVIHKLKSVELDWIADGELVKSDYVYVCMWLKMKRKINSFIVWIDGSILNVINDATIPLLNISDMNDQTASCHAWSKATKLLQESELSLEWRLPHS